MAGGLKQFPNVNSKNDDLNAVQLNLKTALDPIIKNALVGGTTLTSIALKAGANIVAHGLGRTLQGWMIVRKRASADIYDTQDQNGSPQTTLLLTATAPVTVDIYVY